MSKLVSSEQSGAARAAYGQGVLTALSERLTTEFGKGYSVANLRNFRQFFQTFTADEIRYTPGSELSWSHYRMPVREEHPETLARYSLLVDSQQLFASRYRAALPTETELQVGRRRDRALIEAAQPHGAPE